jgi:NAD(P)-dependent dehydrogenase (short-subunit alcohol dehydrogenase family)
VTGLFDGKVALVTGGASGIGEATATRLAAEGATVIVADVDGPGADRVATAIGGYALDLDVSSAAAWDKAVGAVIADHGRLDILFLNAGTMTRPYGSAMFDDPVPWLNADAYDRVMAVNIDGVVYGALAALPHMVDQGGGDIVMTASIAGLVAYPQDAFYGASKHAVVGFAKALGGALDSRRVRVNAICPGGIDTKMPPEDMKAARIMSPPSYIADAVVTILTTEGTGRVWAAYRSGTDPYPYEPPNPRR